MTSSPKIKRESHHVDDALLVPWAATGVIEARDARFFAAAAAADLALESDLAAARAEQAAVVALSEALGRPSPRPMLELFAAIDAEKALTATNVTKLTFDRPHRRWMFETFAETKSQKIIRRR